MTLRLGGALNLDERSRGIQLAPPADAPQDLRVQWYSGVPDSLVVSRDLRVEGDGTPRVLSCEALLRRVKQRPLFDRAKLLPKRRPSADPLDHLTGEFIGLGEKLDRRVIDGKPVQVMGREAVGIRISIAREESGIARLQVTYEDRGLFGRMPDIRRTVKPRTYKGARGVGATIGFGESGGSAGFDATVGMPGGLVGTRYERLSPTKGVAGEVRWVYWLVKVGEDRLTPAAAKRVTEIRVGANPDDKPADPKTARTPITPTKVKVRPLSSDVEQIPGLVHVQWGRRPLRQAEISKAVIAVRTAAGNRALLDVRAGDPLRVLTLRLYDAKGKLLTSRRWMVTAVGGTLDVDSGGDDTRPAAADVAWRKVGDGLALVVLGDAVQTGIVSGPNGKKPKKKR